MKAVAAIGLALALAGCATAPASIAPGARYVAMGSSFASGPGVTTPADGSVRRCSQSNDNYARRLARRRGLALTDVSCGGATTANVLEGWNELPPQIDAVTAETRLVTITIGGNDLGYIGGLITTSCEGLPNEPSPMAGLRDRCPGRQPTLSDEQVEAQMDRIAAEVHRRAPQARLVFVDYLTVLPAGDLCAATPLTPAQAEAGRALARRLAEITARVAARAGAELLAASALSQGHEACAAEAWMNGYPRPNAPVNGTVYHPNLAGMTAVADALDRLIWR